MAPATEQRTPDTSGQIMPVVSAAVVDAMATAAHEAYLVAFMSDHKLDAIKAAILAEPYWDRFAALVKGGAIGIEWLDGNAALGRVIFGWAKGDKR